MEPRRGEQQAAHGEGLDPVARAVQPLHRQHRVQVPGYQHSPGASPRGAHLRACDGVASRMRLTVSAEGWDDLKLDVVIEITLW